jgi:predicted HicB family RNase H-like nuclease
MLKYKGYTGVTELDTDAGVIFGRVIGLRDVITFQGTTVEEVVKEFRESVDVYLEFCASRGEEPEKPYSGQFVLRIDPSLHRAIAHAAEALGTSLNSLIESELEVAFNPGAGKAKTFTYKTKNPLTRKPKRATKAAAKASKAFGRSRS